MAKICNKCGRRIRWSEYSYNGQCEECYKNKVCKRCGKEIIGGKSNNGYCNECYKIIQDEEEKKQRMYCPNCGKEIEVNSSVCYNCGVNPKKIKDINFCFHCGEPVNKEQVICLNCKQSLEKEDDLNNVSVGIILICFLFPIIGLIIYAANNDLKHEYAYSCGIASIVGVIISLLISVITLLALRIIHIFYNYICYYNRESTDIQERLYKD